MAASFSDHVQAFQGMKVLVLGDAILDAYEKGVIEKLCREAPVPIVRLDERCFHCGGAANTAVNTAALGGKVRFMSVLGTDTEGDTLLSLLESHGVDVSGVIRSPARRTIVKTRVCASSNLIVRVDEGDTAEIDATYAEALSTSLAAQMEQCDVIILSDYGYGVFSRKLVEDLEASCTGNRPPIVVDAKHPGKFRCLRPAAAKPNYQEAVRMLGITPTAQGARIEQMLEHGAELLEKTGAGQVAATLDMDGTLLFEQGQPPYLVSCLPQADKRTVGAGDSFVGALSLSLAAGLPSRIATQIAAAAAAVAIQKDGTGICTSEELSAHFNGSTKQLSGHEALADVIRELKEQNRRIVFTNGCFDILHRGHVEFLRQARALGDVLVVALNSDESIHRLKGSGRPVNSLEDRMEVLSGLEAVDLLVPFEGESPMELLRIVQPHVVAKGGTYDLETFPEAELVKSLGGEIEIVPINSRQSTSSLIEKIQYRARIPSTAQNSQRAL